MKPSLFKHPPTLWLSIGAAVLLALLLAAGGFAASVYGQATRQLADIEPRHARLAGLLQNKELLTQAESALDANSSQFIGAASEDPIQLGNTALQRVRDLATGHGLRVTSSQAAAPRDENGLDRIDLTLRVEGQWPQLVALMSDLMRAQPTIFTSVLQFGASNMGAQGQVSAMFGNLNLFVLKERRP